MNELWFLEHGFKRLEKHCATKKKLNQVQLDKIGDFNKKLRETQCNT